MKKIRILVAYHKRAPLYSNEVLLPVHCGRALVASDDPDRDWYLSNLVGDDAGESISAWNREFCELTALYWAWRNPELLGEADYVGLAHYRRLWYLADAFAPATGSILDQIALSAANVHSIVDRFPVVLPRCYSDSTLTFCEFQRHIRLTPERHPILYAGYRRFERDHRYYHCNMFILPRAVFDDYCAQIFPVLIAARDRIERTGQKVFTRFLGYAAEYLSSFYFMHLLDEGRYPACEIPVVYLDLPRAIKV